MDIALFRRINGWTVTTKWLNGPAAAYSKYGIIIFGALIVWAWWKGRRQRDLHRQAGAAWAGGSVLIALSIAQLIGRATHRARPYAALDSVHVLIARTADFSFPSDHATAVGAVAGGLWRIDRKLGSTAAGMAMLMAVARVYAGVHYPTDVAAGLGLGAAVAVAGGIPVTWFIERLLSRIERSSRFSVLARKASSDARPA